MKSFLVAVLVLMLLSGVSAQESTIVFEKGTGEYEIQLLQLALEKTIPDYGSFRLQEWGIDVTEARGNSQLNDRAFDITFRVVTPAIEKSLLVIPIELTRGIQGYRLLLVHRDNLPRFAGVKTLDELRANFVAGFGAQWADLSVLQTNSFRVNTAVESKLLYRMLEAKRFDFFPRGVNEIWDNIVQHSDDAPSMVVEPNLALYYPLVQFFVVAKTDTALAERVRKGLERALADGSMKKLFLSAYKDVLQKARVSQRTEFVLTNPDLPSTGLPDTSWWWPNSPHR